MNSFFVKLVQKLNERKLPYAVVGGYAVALHGAVRGTVDVDIVINFKKKDFMRAESLLCELGLRPRLPVSASEVFEFRKEYVENRNLKAWNFANPTNPIEVVDILLTEDLAVLGKKRVQIRGVSVNLIELEDLIRMKKKAGRPQDLVDVEALKKIKKARLRK